MNRYIITVPHPREIRKNGLYIFYFYSFTNNYSAINIYRVIWIISSMESEAIAKLRLTGNVTSNTICTYFGQLSDRWLAIRSCISRFLRGLGTWLTLWHNEWCHLARILIHRYVLIQCIPVCVFSKTRFIFHLLFFEECYWFCSVCGCLWKSKVSNFEFGICF